MVRTDRITRRQLLTAGSGVAVAGAIGFPALASDFPRKAIRIIVPFQAGGIVDQVARAVSDFASSALGQPVMVEPMPGAGGMIGTMAVARAQPDGHTWLLATSGHVATPLLQASSYDPVDDFVAASYLGRGQHVALVPAASKAHNLADFVQLAKARPGALNYLNPGNGSFSHLAAELLQMNTGAKLQAVAYKGLPQGLQDLAAGRIDFALASLPLPIPFIQTGKMRGIGIMAARRNPAVADVPTFQEQGFASSQMISWSMVLLPAKTPKQIVEQVNAMFNKALQDPEVMQRLRTIHISPADPMPWHEVQSLLATDAKRVAEIVKRAQVKAVN